MTWHPATPTQRLDDKNMVAVEIAGQDIAIYKLDDAFYATGNICTHQLAYMTDGYLEDGCVECPLHQALFDVKTGAVVEGPAKTPLPVFPVKVEGDQVWVELPG